MKAFVALLALVAAAAAVPKGLQDRIVLYPHLLRPNGKGATTPASRIVGGEEATPNEFPFIVALNIDSLYFCGGSIIADDIILTAAHCLDGARSVEVTAGAHNQATSESTQQVVTTTDLTVNADWDSQAINNDIAFARLSSPLELNDNVQPIALATSEPSVGTIVNAAGWGKTCDGLFCGVSDVLNKVQVPVDDDQNALDYYGDLDYSTKICIDATSGSGTCNGDSGGPLFTDSFELIGATSFGAAAGCTSGHPDCFTSIPSFLGWIEDNTGVSPN